MKESVGVALLNVKIVITRLYGHGADLNIKEAKILLIQAVLHQTNPKMKPMITPKFCHLPKHYYKQIQPSQVRLGFFINNQKFKQSPENL